MPLAWPGVCPGADDDDDDVLLGRRKKMANSKGGNGGANFSHYTEVLFGSHFLLLLIKIFFPLADVQISRCYKAPKTEDWDFQGGWIVMGAGGSGTVWDWLSDLVRAKSQPKAFVDPTTRTLSRHRWPTRESTKVAHTHNLLPFIMPPPRVGGGDFSVGLAAR